MHNIVIFGAPGSGKGTQSHRLTHEYALNVLSTGDLLRKEVASGSELGNTCKTIMDDGKFIPEDIMFNLVSNFLESIPETEGVLFDGFPRTVDQAEYLLNLLEKQEDKIDCVVNLEVEDSILLKRILGRFFCKGCGAIYNTFFKKTEIDSVCDECKGTEFYHRSDDNETTVQTRLDVYKELTFPILDFFKKRGVKVVNIDGLLSEEEVFSQIATVVK